MGLQFNDLRSYTNGAFYYENPPLRDLEVADFSAGYRMSKDDIQQWFGIIDTLPQVPPYLIFNETSTQSNFEPFHGHRTHLNGGWGVYEPVQWVPTIHHIQVIPKSALPVEFKRTTTSIEQSKLYASFKSLASLSASASYGAMKAEASVEIKGEVELDLSTTTVQTMSQQATLGNKVVHEIVLGMTMKMRRVYSWQFAQNDVTYLTRINQIGQYVVEDCKWSGATDGRNDISDERLRHVAALQYSAGALKAQVLPAFENNKIANIHVALKSPAWNCWYAYEAPYGSPLNRAEENNAGEITMACGGFKPVATFVATTEEK